MKLANSYGIPAMTRTAGVAGIKAREVVVRGAGSRQVVHPGALGEGIIEGVALYDGLAIGDELGVQRMGEADVVTAGPFAAGAAVGPVDALGRIDDSNVDAARKPYRAINASLAANDVVTIELLPNQ